MVSSSSELNTLTRMYHRHQYVIAVRSGSAEGYQPSTGPLMEWWHTKQSKMKEWWSRRPLHTSTNNGTIPKYSSTPGVVVAYQHATPLSWLSQRWPLWRRRSSSSSSNITNDTDIRLQLKQKQLNDIVGSKSANMSRQHEQSNEQRQQWRVHVLLKSGANSDDLLQAILEATYLRTRLAEFHNDPNHANNASIMDIHGTLDINALRQQAFQYSNSHQQAFIEQLVAGGWNATHLFIEESTIRVEFANPSVTTSSSSINDDSNTNDDVLANQSMNGIINDSAVTNKPFTSAGGTPSPASDEPSHFSGPLRQL
jgi:hypothetical protein